MLKLLEVGDQVFQFVLAAHDIGLVGRVAKEGVDCSWVDVIPLLNIYENIFHNIHVYDI